MSEQSKPSLSYSPFDQRKKLGEPPWSGPVLREWEAAHGHDARLRCLPEFGCLVIEARAEAIEAAAREALVLLDAAADMAHEAYLNDPCEPWKDYEEAHNRLKEALGDG